MLAGVGRFWVFIALPLSVTIDDFDLHGALVGPDEADTPSAVYADAVLSGSVAT